jgi:hypothetical protein
MNVQDGETERQVPRCVPWGDSDGSEHPADRDVEEPPPWTPEEEDERTPGGAKTPVLWC